MGLGCCLVQEQRQYIGMRSGILLRSLRLSTIRSFHLARFEQLKQAVEPCLTDISSQLQKRNFEFPFSCFNSESNEDNQKLMISFRKQLHDQFKQYTTDKSSFIPLPKIQLVDFINPHINTITQLIYMVNGDRVPINFLEYSKITTKQQLITKLLTQLLYRHYNERKIRTTRSESKTIDFSNPSEWYPNARKMKRKIVMHVGPTNSGKTYHSLLKLEKARSGYYAGPLRLLAREIFEKFQQRGVSCNLVTGEEIIPSYDDNGVISEISAGTVEMIPLNKKMDICVIDEIQMIGDHQRGAAWTNALLGVLAKEIHLCGEESAVQLVKKIVAVTGDELEIKRFKRFGKLTVQNRITSFTTLKKGDCVVAFSKKKILDLKNQIEQNTRLKVGIVYGSLPPEIRSKEAQSFNNGEYDVLVASDAIGMGLNLKIKRIVFQSVKKFNGKDLQGLSDSQVKQIAGRAGRYFAKDGMQEGFVTALDMPTLKYVRNAMAKPVVQLEKAALWPTPAVWKHHMANWDTNEPYLDTLYRFAKKVPKLKLKDYFISPMEIEKRCELLSMFKPGKLHDKIEIDDQITLSDVPLRLRDDHGGPVYNAMREMVESVATNKSRGLLHYSFIDLKLLEMEPSRSFDVDEPMQRVQQLEIMHNLILVFMWLSQRFSTLFIDKESMYDLKALVEKRISEEMQVVKRINKSTKGY
ncbi:uncharacterized protein SPAPADRAFT_71052 [Spathaspora passalidarum NRRL Y-27907]|uniref:ATP-dependent RNA helicase SUV3, mitochondrial n=1 Tax=Spathaspora passalidarum (strain NRRL Y-27907 / 11-Y1) TaxID=619300 RepID=G3ALB3_SPAPN|nr:uncharacterized protein SPAPADRAFT_71052 [Spathaspora passalidarum NRRL Y-27907]EGW33156.1 hypothetical protein SPAPADRAFT_71052 [Spathaspora passalidarum NRRL Y-27907]